MSPFRLAWADFARRRAAAALAIAALSLAVGLSGALYRLARTAEARFAGLARAGDAIIGAKAGEIDIVLGCLGGEGPYPGFIPGRLYFSLLNHAKLTAAAGAPEPPFHKALVPLLYAGRFRGRPIIGANAELLKLTGPGFAVALARGAWAADSGQAVLGERLAREAGLGPGDTFYASPWAGNGDGWVIPYPLRVVGILSRMGNAWDAAAFTNLGEARRLAERGGLFAHSAWGADVVNYMLIETAPGRLPALRDLVDKRTVAQLVEVDSGLAALRSLTGSGRATAGAAAALALSLSAFCILGLAIGSLEEKARHFAMLRALGYANGELRALAFWQGALPAAAGCAGGALLDACLFPVLRARLGNALPPPADVPSHWVQSAPVWLAFAAIAALASLLPYWRFRRRPAHASIQALS